MWPLAAPGEPWPGEAARPTGDPLPLRPAACWGIGPGCIRTRSGPHTKRLEYRGRLRPACQTLPMTHALHLTAAVTHEGEWYVARCLQVEVTSQGETIEEALLNLREALELYFEDAPAPDVTEVITAPVEVRVA